MMSPTKRSLSLQASLLALAWMSGTGHADALTDCKTRNSGEATMAACSEVIGSATAAAGDRAEALRRRAQFHAERGASAQAAADWDAALRLEPQSGQALIGRARARLSQGETDGAIADFGEAMRISGKSAGLLVARGYALLVKGDAASAIADFTAAIALQPQNASAYNNRGLAHRKNGDLASAIADYSSAIQLNPAFAQAHANRGYVYEAQGDKAAAVADLQRALSLDPSLTGAASGLKRLGQPAEARSEALIAHGQLLAQKNCAWCHAIGSTGDSPNPRAPRWRDLAKRNPILALRDPLTRGIARPHDEMPKFALSDAETDTIIAYINSLER